MVYLAGMMKNANPHYFLKNQKWQDQNKKSYQLDVLAYCSRLFPYIFEIHIWRCGQFLSYM